MSAMDKVGIIDKNMPVAIEFMHRCKLCPRHCGIDRLADKKGFCGVGKDMIVSSIGLHHGEEPPIFASVIAIFIKKDALQPEICLSKNHIFPTH